MVRQRGGEGGGIAFADRRERRPHRRRGEIVTPYAIGLGHRDKPGRESSPQARFVHVGHIDRGYDHLIGRNIPIFYGFAVIGDRHAMAALGLPGQTAAIGRTGDGPEATMPLCLPRVSALRHAVRKRTMQCTLCDGRSHRGLRGRGVISPHHSRPRFFKTQSGRRR